MSGGYFNYEQYKIGQIADQIDQLILTNNDEELNEWGQHNGYHFSEETIAEFKNALSILKQAQIYAQRIDWLVSGDDSEDNFHKRLKKELDNE